MNIMFVRIAYRSVICPVESMRSDGDENPLPVMQLVNSIDVHSVLEVRRRQLQQPLDLCAPREAHGLNSGEQLHVHGNHLCLSRNHFFQSFRQLHVLSDADQIVNVVDRAIQTTCKHIISYHIISYHIISLYIISYHYLSSFVS